MNFTYWNLGQQPTDTSGKIPRLTTGLESGKLARSQCHLDSPMVDAEVVPPARDARLADTAAWSELP